MNAVQCKYTVLTTISKVNILWMQSNQMYTMPRKQTLLLTLDFVVVISALLHVNTAPLNTNFGQFTAEWLLTPY